MSRDVVVKGEGLEVLEEDFKGLGGGEDFEGGEGVRGS